MGHALIARSFSVPADVTVGASEGGHTETFRTVVQSPQWLRDHHGGSEVLIGAGRLFASRPDTDAIRQGLEESLHGFIAPSWRLLRLGLTGLGEPIPN